MRPATFDLADVSPAWYPDGRRFAFSSVGTLPRHILAKAADGTGSVEQLTTSTFPQTTGDISPDGHWLVFTEQGANGPDILGLSLDTRTIKPLVQTPSARNPRISPDGHWLAYEADDSGRMEIYVRPFPEVNSGHWRVSAGGGVKPIWSRDSRELFYFAPSGELQDVVVAASPGWSAASPVTVLAAKYRALSGSQYQVPYDISRDGRFLMLKGAGDAAEAAGPTSLVVVQHFDQELKRVLGR